jgi:hypothetical protein
MTSSRRRFKGYLITVTGKDAPGVWGHVRVETPAGRTISCLKQGIHVVLSELPSDVRREAECMAGWR